MSKNEKGPIGTLAKIFGIISISFQGLIIVFMLLCFFSRDMTLVPITNVLISIDGMLITLLLAPAGIILSIIGLVKGQKGSGLGLGLSIPCLILPFLLFAVLNFVMNSIY